MSIMNIPQKSNIDTKNCLFFKGVTFSKPSFWVSMLVFGGVDISIMNNETRTPFVFQGQDQINLKKSHLKIHGRIHLQVL